MEGSPVMSPAAFFARPVILSMMLMGASYPIGCGRNSRTALDGRARACLHWQADLDPVGLALRVLAHIRVAESDQLVRRDLGVPAGEARAVGDDCGVLVWQQLGRLRLELLVVDADRAGDVLLGEAFLAEGLHHHDLGAVEQRLELVAGDLGSHLRPPCCCFPDRRPVTSRRVYRTAVRFYAVLCVGVMGGPWSGCR